MKIQKIIETTKETSGESGSFDLKIIEYEISTERMKNLPHTFGNFTCEDDFHSAFFDTNHPKHAEAYEILEHVLKPTAIYVDQQSRTTNEYWASQENIRTPSGKSIMF